MIATKKAVLERIRSAEEGIRRAKEYLRTGAHENWVGFRPLFAAKTRAGKDVPPHKDWVRNVYLPRLERARARDEKLLERLE